MQHVGVGTFFQREVPTQWLKRYALLFDQIQIADLDYSRRAYSAVPRMVHGAIEPDATLADIEYLTDAEFVKQASATEKRAEPLPNAIAKTYGNSWLELDKLAASISEAVNKHVALALPAQAEEDAFAPEQWESTTLGLGGPLAIRKR